MGKNFGYSFSTEGTPTWIDCAILTVKCDRQEVYDFINANLTREWQGRVITDSFNNGVLTAEEAKVAGLPEDILLKTIVVDQATDGFWKKMLVLAPPEDIDRRLQMWNDFRAETL